MKQITCKKKDLMAFQLNSNLGSMERMQKRVNNRAVIEFKIKKSICLSVGQKMVFYDVTLEFFFLHQKTTFMVLILISKIIFQRSDCKTSTKVQTRLGWTSTSYTSPKTQSWRKNETFPSNTRRYLELFQRLFNVMDVRWTSKQRCVFTKFLVFRVTAFAASIMQYIELFEIKNLAPRKPEIRSCT